MNNSLRQPFSKAKMENICAALSSLALCINFKRGTDLISGNTDFKEVRGFYRVVSRDPVQMQGQGCCFVAPTHLLVDMVSTKAFVCHGCLDV